MSDVLPGELLEHVYHGREERNLEYKERLDWSDPKDREKIVKCALGMSNIRNGGVLVIGVRKDGHPVGLSEAQLRSFTQDGVSALVNGFAAPYIELTVSVGRDKTAGSSWFVVIEVQEFAEQPVLCRRDWRSLVEGGLYSRGRRIHETAPVRSETEMREILEMATEKRLRSLQRLVQAAGLQVSAGISDRQLFEAQLGGL